MPLTYKEPRESRTEVILSMARFQFFSNKIRLCCHFVADEIAAEERNEYCQSKTKAGCTAPVYAMFDGEPSDRSKRWRCYFSEAVKVNDMGQVEYDTSTNSNCYVTIEEAEFFDII